MTATPVMVHKTNLPEANAAAPPGTRIITADRLERLRAAIRGAAVALADAGTWAIRFPWISSSATTT